MARLEPPRGTEDDVSDDEEEEEEKEIVDGHMAEPKADSRDDERAVEESLVTSMVSKNDPHAELKASWVLAGEKLEDFTVGKYKKKLREQDKADFKLRFIKGETSYEAKMEALERIRVWRLRARKLALAPLLVPKIMAADAFWLGKGVAKALEPRFEKRARVRSKQLARIATHEAEAMALQEKMEQVRLGREEARRVENRIAHERGIQLEHAKPSDAVKEAAERREREKKREAELEHFRWRRHLAQAEIEAARTAKLEEEERKQVADAKRRREWRSQHYTQVAVAARAETSKRHADAGLRLDQREAELAARDAAETIERDVASAVDQTKGPEVTESSGQGVFGGEGVPSADGSSGADHARIRLFSARPVEVHEKRWHELARLEAELGRADTDYEAFSRKEGEAADHAAALDARRNLLGIERAQLRAEHELLLRRVAGPPRREATDAEREATHRRQTRAAELARRERQLEHRSGRSRQRSRDAAVSKARAESRAAALRERCADLRRRLEARLGGAGDPPIIIGQAIGKGVGGDDRNMNGAKFSWLSALKAQPEETYLAVTAKTKLELAHSEAKRVLASRKKIKALEQMVWAREQEHINERVHLDDMITRLADIMDRVKRARSDDVRQDLQQAVQLWWTNGERLRTINARHQGPINWWASRVDALCSGVEQWRSSDYYDFDGLGAEVNEDTPPASLTRCEREEHPHLQGAAHGASVSGTLVGEMELPKLDLYAIELVITKRNPDSVELGDPTDRCTLKLGTSLRTLSTVATVKNVMDEYSGAARFEISHTIRAATLAWRVEFMSSTSDPATHFVLEQGGYAPKDIPPLEATDGTNRVVSSFVKQLRVQRQQGHTKYANWLAELIRAEEHSSEQHQQRLTSDQSELVKKKTKNSQRAVPKNPTEQLLPPSGPWWDSKAFHGTPQRFPIESFCKLMRNELVQAAQNHAECSKGAAATLRSTKEQADASSRCCIGPAIKTRTSLREENRARRVRASASRYLVRKRALWQPKIAKAESLVGGTLEVYYEDEQRWVHTQICDVEISWYDNGTCCAIRHSIVPVDDFERTIGPAKWVEIEKLRSYVSKRVESDPETRAIWEANEAAEAAADAQNLLARLKAEARRQDREAKEASETRKFERVRSEAIQRRRETAKVEASAMMETRAILVLIKKIARQVIEELRAGLINAVDIGAAGDPNQSGALDATDFSEAFVAFTKIDAVAEGAQKEVEETEGEDGHPTQARGTLRRLVSSGWAKLVGRPHTARDLKPLPLVSVTPRAVRRKQRQKKLRKAALSEAKRRWAADYVKAIVSAEERQWEAAAAQRDVELESAKKSEQTALDKAAKEAAARERALEKERAVQRKRRREATRKKIGIIPNFRLAVAVAANCEHTRSKAWGNRYGKGVRCLDCGKELTHTHLDEDQQRGIGSGDDRALCTRVRRHRFNRPAYHAETDDIAAELAAVEAERRRLEKERYALRDAEPHFYDLDEMKRVYDFDRRHQRVLKDNDVLRQGVQWTVAEVADRIDYIKRSGGDDDATPRVKKAALLAAHDFQKEANPPTPRVDENRRRAAFRDLLLAAGRINNFRLRVSELEAQRVSVDAERRVLSNVLCELHREVFSNEETLEHVAQELTRTAGILKLRQRTQERLDDAVEILKQARLDYKKKEITVVGLADNADDAEADAAALATAVRDLLRQRYRQTQTLQAVQERAEACRQRADAVAVAVVKTQNVVDSMHYCQRGVLLPTPYGHCNVLLYRATDRMVVVQLGFCNARAYIPMDAIMQTERAIAASNLVAMRDEERRARAFYAREASFCARECRAMHEDEIQLREVLAFKASILEDRQLVAGKVEVEVERARKFICSRAGRKEIMRRASRSVKKEARRREIAQRTWRGKGRRPKKMSVLDKARFKLAEFRRLRKECVLDRARQADAGARAAIERCNDARVADETVEFVYASFVHDFLGELADEALRAGLEARSRTEDETGIVLDGPPHMQYPVYNLLSQWWVDRKKQLKQQLDSWGVRSVKDELQREADRQQRQALVRDIELKEAREKERRRQAACVRRMSQEELEVRRFYREELRHNLFERRAMKNEELETQAYVTDLARIANLAASKYHVGSEPDVSSLKTTSKFQRRYQIKRERVGREQRQRERDEMALEDELSRQARLDERKREQLEALSAEIALFDENDPGEASDDDDEDTSSSSPRSRRALRITKARKRVATKREAAELAALEELEAARLEARIAHATAELEWMEREEEARLVEKELRVAQENVRKVTLYTQRKGQEELRARSKATKARKTCAERTSARDNAADWLAQCEARHAVCRRAAARVAADTKYADTRAITGVYQRFETTELYAQLHAYYFRRLVYVVANRAEVIATERRQMVLHDVLQRNRAATLEREAALGAVWRKRVRDDLLRLRRSELGKKMFAKSQRRVLVAVFRGWMRYWRWHLGHRKKYELDYALLKHNLDLERRHPVLRRDVTTNEPQETGEVERDQTRLEDLQQRVIECVTCGELYTEVRNRSDACAYHPGDYGLSCPRSCPGSVDARCVTTQCMAHRAKRWSCCDSRHHRGSGCRRRFHVPPRETGAYGEVARKRTEEYRATEAELDQGLAQVKAADVVHALSLDHRAQLDDVAAALDAERSIVAKFKAMRCDRYVDQDAIVEVIKDQWHARQVEFRERYNLVVDVQ